ncbi:hypothetical protein JW758_01965 [Candidatus Peregrinibacteria bacterium]|nr:hypothetical protein [Candidatus Peregrinibacteria bacterium]
MKKFLFLILFILTTQNVFAHQPRIVDEQFTKIDNPEISQAFYGSLDGEAQQFVINSENEFELYLGVLVPDLPDIGKDISFVVYKDNQILWSFDGPTYKWEKYYEEYAGDRYFKGPELKAEGDSELPKGIKVDSGTYVIEVYSTDNEGKYVLAVGTIESFKFKEIINTVKTLPKLKTDFFEKPIYTLVQSKIGMYLIVPSIALLLIILVIAYFIKIAQ